MGGGVPVIRDGLVWGRRTSSSRTLRKGEREVRNRYEWKEDNEFVISRKESSRITVNDKDGGS